MTRIQWEQQGDVWIGHLLMTTIEASNADKFRNSVADYCNRLDKVVLDLTNIRFVDSSGMGSLISCLRMMTAHQGQFKLASLQQGVITLFELLGMNKVFSIHATCEAAVDSFVA